MYADLTNTGYQNLDANDSIVIVRHFDSIRGGRTLDVTNFTPEVIKAGHVIIQETATGNFKPMPLNGGATAYASLPTGHTYAGILIATILTKKPFASILVNGTVNPAAAPFDMSTILSAVKTALPLIAFRQD
ncbi:MULTISPECIES: hypothetical protein [unclassified Spirosoma]|uniref:hypothetical protein n=1 Tax=unclassified Spirosoma TaxID=2621999 RepID=UPI00095F1048|nr:MULTISPECIES: hypothetical protein [unclassified Spirosoma]MBN8821280.1 hypothetical protein [Spirosoma sp.]OJW78069.1 MAG: hypothetical protein BGO59_29055 [Spirosoma sp. 48-14]